MTKCLKTFIVSIGIFFLSVTTVQAAGLPSKWFGSYGAQTSTSGARQLSPFGGSTIVNGEPNAVQLAPSAGTVQKLRVQIDAAPGSGKSYVVTFRKELADTTLTCTISDLATSCSDAIHTVSIVAGDRLAVNVTPSGTPAAARVSFNLEFVPTTDGETVFMGGAGGNMTADTSMHCGPFLGASFGTCLNETNVQTIVSTSGTLKNLYVRLSAAPSTSNSRTFTVRKNAVDTGLTVTFNATDSGVLSDTNAAHNVTVAAGDSITLGATGVGTPTAAQTAYGVVFVPDTNGDFVIPITNSSVSASAVNYLGLSGVNVVSATETSVQTLGSSEYTLTAAYVKIGSAPGVGKSFTTSLRENALNASSPFTVTISGSSATTGNITGQSFTPVNGALYDTMVTPSGTPSTGRMFVSYLGHIISDVTSPTPGNSGTITTSNVQATTLTLNWTKGTDNVSAQANLQYEVRQSSSNNIDSVANAEANGSIIRSYTADINTFNVIGLAPSTTYYFNVIAKDEAGNKVIYTTKSETTAAPDTTPPTSGNSGTITTASVAGHSLTLNWTKGTDNVSAQANLQYEVRQSSSNNIDSVANAEANGSIIRSYTADINTFNVTGLAPLTAYYFNVIVKDESGNKTAYTTKNETTAAGATYYVDNTAVGASDSNDGLTATYSSGINGPWLTISKCASTIISGDTCQVQTGGTYNERVTETTDGAAGGGVITYKAQAGSPRPKVRDFSITGADYITIDGFEITNVGMSTDLGRNIDISASTRVSILNNIFQHTPSVCIRTSGSSFVRIAGNTASYCGEISDVEGTTTPNFTITTGVNDTLKYKMQGGSSNTVVLTAGTRTTAQICADMNAVTSGVCTALASNGVLTLRSTTTGPTSSLEIESVANSAYATLGIAVGVAPITGHSAFSQGGAATSNDVLIENNNGSHLGDYVTLGTDDTRIVVRNNSWGPVDFPNGDHIDGLQTNGTNGGPYLLYEANTSSYNNNYDNHSVLFQRPLDTNIISRFNTTFHANGYNDCTRGGNTTAPGFFFYNNTYYNNFAITGSSNQQVNCGSSANNLARNNIWYNSTNPAQPVYAGLIDKDYDLWYLGGNPQETHSVNADPLFVDGAAGDFTLQSGSPAINQGGPLATTTSSGTNSTSLVVSNAGSFQDGWAGVDPDWIAIGTASNVVQISSINYNTNTITLVSSMSWSSNDPVYLYKRSDATRVLYGSAPDIGAYEYVSTSAPTVTTQSASSMTTTGATGNGNITATGGSNATVRGFVYGLTASYGATTTESGSFSTGAYTGSISSLTCNTGYHVAAYATNPIGTSYGSDSTFTTSACPDVTPPVLSVGSPSGTLSSGTTGATLSVTTNESATCRYGTVAGTAYASISGTFSTTGGTTHTQSLTGLSSGSYSYYIRCTDGSNPNLSDYAVSFSITADAEISSSKGTSAARKAQNLLSKGTPQSSATASRTQSQAPTFSQFIDILISVGAIPPERAEQAKAAVSASTASPSSFSFTRDLQLHDKGSDVSALQSLLISKGYLAPGNDVGTFGPMTFKALKLYQASLGLPQTGYFGPLTKSAAAR